MKTRFFHGQIDARPGNTVRLYVCSSVRRTIAKAYIKYLRRMIKFEEFLVLYKHRYSRGMLVLGLKGQTRNNDNHVFQIFHVQSLLPDHGMNKFDITVIFVLIFLCSSLITLIKMITATAFKMKIIWKNELSTYISDFERLPPKLSK